MTKKLSASMEDYLKEIYLIAKDGNVVRVTDVATVLEISKASVNKAINNLKGMGYLVHEYYGTIQLTALGEKEAVNILESYRVSYKFLSEILDVDAERAAQEAHQMEHILSKSTRKKLKKFIKKQKKA